MKISRQTLFWSIVVWLFFISAFFGHQIFGILSGGVVPDSETKTNRLGEYGFYLIFILGLLVLKLRFDKKGTGEKNNKGVLFLLKTLVASYAISFTVTMLFLGLIHIAFSQIMFDTILRNLQLVIFTMTLIFMPIVYRKIE